MTTQNKRQYERKHVRLKGNLVNENIQSNITLVDLSEKGLAFITHHAHQVGEIIEVELKLAHDCIIHLKVEIKNMMSDIFANRIGAQILEMPQTYLEYIQSFFAKPKSRFMQSLQTLSA